MICEWMIVCEPIHWKEVLKSSAILVLFIYYSSFDLILAIVIL